MNLFIKYYIGFKKTYLPFLILFILKLIQLFTKLLHEIIKKFFDYFINILFKKIITINNVRIITK